MVMKACRTARLWAVCGLVQMVIVARVLAVDAQEPVAKILVAKNGYALDYAYCRVGRVYLVYKGSRSQAAGRGSRTDCSLRPRRGLTPSLNGRSRSRSLSR